MEKKLVTWVREDRVAILTIDHPPVNAMSQQVIDETYACLEEIEKDEQSKVLIITGAGEKAFMAGADIKELPGYLGKPGAAGEFSRRAREKFFSAVDNFPKPTIAALNGLTLGGGCELALACDIRIAQENVQIGLPEIKLGVFPGGGGTQRLPRLVGEAKAKELMFCGDPISAEEALRIGLVNKVVPNGKVLEEAKRMAAKIAGYSIIPLMIIKEAVDRGLQMSLAEGLKIEGDLFDRVFLAEDAREGITAFIEKRKAEFKDR